MTNKGFNLVFVRYMDHVLFNRGSPLFVKPQIREAIGWLNYECEEYIILSWDKDADSPTLKGGDPKASGLVLLKLAILELTNLQVTALPLQKNSERHLNYSEHQLDMSMRSEQPSEKLNPNKQKRVDKQPCRH